MDAGNPMPPPTPHAIDSEQCESNGDVCVDTQAGGALVRQKWTAAQALELTDVAARFIRRGDPLPAIALLSRALEALAGMAAGKSRGKGDDVGSW